MLRRMKELKITGSDKTTLVDDAEYDYINGRYNIYLIDSVFGYWASISVCGKTFPLHRFLLNMSPDAKRMVDHINRNGLDNRRCNLRPATAEQNAANRRDRLKGSAQKYQGVTRVIRATEDWYTARTSRRNKATNHGYFKCEEEAARFRDKCARDVFGEFAYQNFPDLK